MDHPSQHPTAELAELGEDWDWDKIPSPAVVFQLRGKEGIPPSPRSKLKKKTQTIVPLGRLLSLHPVILFCDCFLICLFVKREGQGLIAASPKPKREGSGRTDGLV